MSKDSGEEELATATADSLREWKQEKQVQEQQQIPFGNGRLEKQVQEQVQQQQQQQQQIPCGNDRKKRMTERKARAAGF